MKRKRHVTHVDIGGQTFCISSDVDEGTTRQVVECVDAQMRRIRARDGQLSHSKLAVLAALELASELIQLRGERARLIEQAHGQIKRLSELVEQRSALLPMTSAWMEGRSKRVPC